MTEFHCWTVIQYDSHDTDLVLQKLCVDSCENYLKSHEYLTEDKYKVVKYNGINTFLTSGLHNHKADYILEIFKWLGQNARGSYGLLYIQNDEEVETYKGFKVFVMKKGIVSERMDSLLSPRIPTIEDETDWTKD
jgi:hypothetical protein